MIYYLKRFNKGAFTSFQFESSRFSPGMRIVSFVTIFMFAMTSTAAAQIPQGVLVSSSSPAAPLNLSSFKIPENLGKIETFSRQEDSKPFLIYIQDAHAIQDAQSNIQQLIQYFQERYGIDTVGVEGSSDHLDATLFRTFPDKTVSKRVLSDYLSRGELSGAEMAAIFGPGEVEYHGLESWDLYERNYKAYLAAQQSRGEILEKLDAVILELDEKRRSEYSPELNAFHDEVRSFELEKTNLLKFLGYIVSLEKEHKISFSISGNEYSQLKPLFEVIQTEDSSKSESLDAAVRKAAEDFKKKYLFQPGLAAEKAKNFNSEYQKYVTGSMDSGRFLKYLKTAARESGIPLKFTSDMREAAGQSEMLSMIKGTKLFDELESLLERIETEFLKTSGQKELAANYKRISRLRNLARLELTREEWDLFLADRPGDLSVLNSAEDGKLFSSSIEFYEAATQRDSQFIRKIGTLLQKKKAKAAVMLAGGFHSQGFEAQLKKSGYSYAVISPKMDSLAGHEFYSGIMMGRLSYKSYIKTTLYDAFVRHATARLVGELNEPDFRRNLKIWRDDTIRALSKRGQIEKSGEYTRYIDFLLNIYREKFEKSRGEIKSRKEFLKTVEEELLRFNEKKVQNLWNQFEGQWKKFMEGYKGLESQGEVTQETVNRLLNSAGQAKPSVLSGLQVLDQGSRPIRLTVKTRSTSVRALTQKPEIKAPAKTRPVQQKSSARRAAAVSQKTRPVTTQMSELRRVQTPEVTREQAAAAYKNGGIEILMADLNELVKKHGVQKVFDDLHSLSVYNPSVNDRWFNTWLEGKRAREVRLTLAKHDFMKGKNARKYLQQLLRVFDAPSSLEKTPYKKKNRESSDPQIRARTLANAAEYALALAEAIALGIGDRELHIKNLDEILKILSSRPLKKTSEAYAGATARLYNKVARRMAFSEDYRTERKGVPKKIRELSIKYYTQAIAYVNTFDQAYELEDAEAIARIKTEAETKRSYLRPREAAAYKKANDKKPAPDAAFQRNVKKILQKLKGLEDGGVNVKKALQQLSRKRNIKAPWFWENEDAKKVRLALAAEADFAFLKEPNDYLMILRDIYDAPPLDKTTYNMATAGNVRASMQYGMALAEALALEIGDENKNRKNLQNILTAVSSRKLPGADRHGRATQIRINALFFNSVANRLRGRAGFNNPNPSPETREVRDLAIRIFGDTQKYIKRVQDPKDLENVSDIVRAAQTSLEAITRSELRSVEKIRENLGKLKSSDVAVLQNALRFRREAGAPRFARQVISVDPDSTRNPGGNYDWNEDNEANNAVRDSFFGQGRSNPGQFSDTAARDLAYAIIGYALYDFSEQGDPIGYPSSLVQGIRIAAITDYKVSDETVQKEKEAQRLRRGAIIPRAVEISNTQPRLSDLQRAERVLALIDEFQELQREGDAFSAAIAALSTGINIFTDYMVDNNDEAVVRLTASILYLLNLKIVWLQADDVTKTLIEAALSAARFTAVDEDNLESARDLAATLSALANQYRVPGQEYRELTSNPARVVNPAGARSAILSTTVSPDGKLIAGGSSDSLRVWNASDLNADPVTVSPRGDTTISFSSDGKLLALNNLGAVELWPVSPDGEPRSAPLTRFRPKENGGTIKSLAFSTAPGEAMLVSAYGSGHIFLLDAALPEELTVAADFDGSAYGPIRGGNDVVTSANGKRIVSLHGPEDRTLLVWNTELRGYVNYPRISINVPQEYGKVTSFAVSPDGKTVSTTHDRHILVWDAGSLESQSVPRAVFELEFSTSVSELAFSPDGSFLAAALTNGRTVLLNPASSGEVSPLTTFVGHRGYATSLSFSPDSRFLATTGHDKTVRIFETGARGSSGALAVFPHKEDIRYLAFNPDGQSIITRNKDGLFSWSISNLIVSQSSELRGGETTLDESVEEEPGIGMTEEETYVLDPAEVSLLDLRNLIGNLERTKDAAGVLKPENIRDMARAKELIDKIEAEGITEESFEAVVRLLRSVVERSSELRSTVPIVWDYFEIFNEARFLLGLAGRDVDLLPSADEAANLPDEEFELKLAGAAALLLALYQGSTDAEAVEGYQELAEAYNVLSNKLGRELTRRFRLAFPRKLEEPQAAQDQPSQIGEPAAPSAVRPFVDADYLRESAAKILSAENLDLTGTPISSLEDLTGNQKLGFLMSALGNMQTPEEFSAVLKYIYQTDFTKSSNDFKRRQLKTFTLPQLAEFLKDNYPKLQFKVKFSPSAQKALGYTTSVGEGKLSSLIRILLAATLKDLDEVSYQKQLVTVTYRESNAGVEQPDFISIPGRLESLSEDKSYAIFIQQDGAVKKFALKASSAHSLPIIKFVQRSSELRSEVRDGEATRLPRGFTAPAAAPAPAEIAISDLERIIGEIDKNASGETIEENQETVERLRDMIQRLQTEGEAAVPDADELVLEILNQSSELRRTAKALTTAAKRAVRRTGTRQVNATAAAALGVMLPKNADPQKADAAVFQARLGQYRRGLGEFKEKLKAALGSDPYSFILGENLEAELNRIAGESLGEFLASSSLSSGRQQSFAEEFGLVGELAEILRTLTLEAMLDLSVISGLAANTEGINSDAKNLMKTLGVQGFLNEFLPWLAAARPDLNLQLPADGKFNLGNEHFIFDAVLIAKLEAAIEAFREINVTVAFNSKIPEEAKLAQELKKKILLLGLIAVREKLKEKNLSADARENGLYILEAGKEVDKLSDSPTTGYYTTRRAEELGPEALLVIAVLIKAIRDPRFKKDGKNLVDLRDERLISELAGLINKFADEAKARAEIRQSA